MGVREPEMSLDDEEKEILDKKLIRNPALSDLVPH
jgi:hypothetical protein